MHFNTDGGFDVLKDINLHAKNGEFICLLGPSGCGKSVLIYLIAGFLKQTSGEIFIEDKLIGKPNIDRMVVFQDYVLFPWKSVFGNIMFGLHSINLPLKKKKALVDETLALVGLEKFKDWPIHKLSGGMQQRVAIGRALICNPKILLMDEPFSAIDSQNRLVMRQKLVEIWRNTKKTIIFVTHSVPEAVYLADKIYLLTTRPASVKEVIKVNLPRPRDRRGKEFNELAKKIEASLFEELQKTPFSQNADSFLKNYKNFNL